MEEKSRGLSLRKKHSVRPKISAPRQISKPISAPIPTTNAPGLASSGLAPPGAGNERRPSITTVDSQSSLTPSVRPRADGTTADYVKRRYSTKIPQLPNAGFGDAPALPSVPSQYLQQPPPRADVRRISSSGPGAAGSELVVDLRALNDPDLKPEQYVSKILANASESDIRNYQAELMKQKHRNSTDLQHNVYQNRNQFIKISQEADKLKAEMRTLRSLMSELTGTLGVTNAALGISTETSGSASSSTSSARRYANRSSVANLEAIWTTHLQELWRRVEGSQRFLPAIPGRHVVHESGRWVELNAATWKPKRRVHLILLNDHLLMATEKRRIEHSPQPNSGAFAEGGPSRGQAGGVTLVAERCWQLLDTELTDLGTKTVPTSKPLKDGKPPNAHAINLRHGSESFTFAATDSEGIEKTTFLARFRKAAAELKRSLHLDADSSGPAGRSQSSRDIRSSSPAAAAAAAQRNGGAEPAPGAKAAMLVDVDGRQQEFRWVETNVDELDIDIALQRFDKAVQRVELLRRIAKSNRSNAAVQELFDERVQRSASRLSKAIVRQMTATNAQMEPTQKHVAWLVKLGFEARASEAYLESRSAVIRTRIGQCVDAGDLHQYLYQISFIYFTLIRNTIAIYQACFPPAVMSSAIKWATDNVNVFNELLSRQTSKLEPGGGEWSYCMKRAREHAGMLSDVGIDFEDLIGRQLGHV